MASFKLDHIKVFIFIFCLGITTTHFFVSSVATEESLSEDAAIDGEDVILKPGIASPAENGLIKGELQVSLSGSKSVRINDVYCEFKQCVFSYTQNKREVNNLFVKVKTTFPRNDAATIVATSEKRGNRMTVTSDGDKMYAVQTMGPFIDGEVAAMNPLTYQYDSSTEQPVAVDSSSSDQLPNNNNNNITSTAYFKKERLLWTEWVCTRMIIIASICIMLFILLIRFIFGRYRKQASFVIRKIFVRRRTVDYTRVAYI